jgi:hypothetical protein
VRAALEVLVRSKKFDHAVGLLKAAIRHGTVEPWMYEALALVQEAASVDKDEFQRTVLSAADMVSDSPDAQYRVAKLLARHDLKEAAIRLYREAADKAPLAHEPYLESLELAVELGDARTVTWAATRLLSQAWVNVQDELHKLALSRAIEFEQRLRKAGRTSEADDLSQQIQEANTRDLVIRMTWQGDADLDLNVLEPFGTICSPQNRVTAAGGVLAKDSFGKDVGSAKNPGELYVCSRGLSGPYEIRVERIWGNPLGGRAKIEVTLHEGTPQQKRTTHFLSVTSSKPLVVDLATGRRTQLLAIPQFVPPVTSSAGTKLPLQELTESMAQSGRSPFSGPQQLFQFGGGGGAIGFQPLVQVFPNGTSLSVTPVVSADRMYVRMTLAPFVSQISGERRFPVSGAVGGGGFGGGFGGF